MMESYIPTKTMELPDGRRVFSNTRLQKAIDEAAQLLGPNDTFAVVAHPIFTQDGTSYEASATLSAIVRLPSGFSVAVAAYKNWTKPLDQGVEARVVWKP